MNSLNKSTLLILAPFTSVPGEVKFNRFYLLAELFSKTKKVTLITSNFNHNNKSHNRSRYYTVSDSFDIICLQELGYKKNISIKRFISHLCFTLNFFNFFLNNREKFRSSTILAAYPLVFPVFLLSIFKSRYKYKLVVDINDVWPQAFGHLLPKQFRFVLNSSLFNFISHYVYKKSDVIVSVSNTYLDYAIKSNPFAINYVLYLGSENLFSHMYLDDSSFINEEVHFSYIGALGTSYDLETCIRAFNSLNIYNNKRIYFHIFGDGPTKNYLEKISKDNIIFHGFLEYSKMLKLVRKTNFLVNPIKDGASQSVTNKISDYILLQKPIISSQFSAEVQSFFNHQSYYQYTSGDVNDFTLKVKEIICENKPIVLSKDIINLFDRNHSYPTFVNWLNSL